MRKNDHACLTCIKDYAGAGGFVNPAIHPVQEPSSEAKGYPTQESAVAGPGGFREDNYKTDYGSAFTYSHEKPLKE